MVVGALIRGTIGSIVVSLCLYQWKDWGLHFDCKTELLSISATLHVFWTFDNSLFYFYVQSSSMKQSFTLSSSLFAGCFLINSLCIICQISHKLLKEAANLEAWPIRYFPQDLLDELISGLRLSGGHTHAQINGNSVLVQICDCLLTHWPKHLKWDSLGQWFPICGPQTPGGPRWYCKWAVKSFSK